MKPAGICIVIKGSAFEAEEAIKCADIVEWRLDLFESLEINNLKKLFEKFDCPVIFTLRPASQGGKCALLEEERLSMLKQLAALGPAYLDVEYTVPQEFVDAIKAEYPKIHIICSYHNFIKTPADLSKVLQNMPRADYYKIACMAHSPQDTLSLLVFAKEAPSNCVVMSMGESGSYSRILAPVVGRPFTYASLDDDKAVVQGQVTAKELLHTYSYKDLSPSTAIYGLIGDPVSKSVSHVSHNEVMRTLQLSSVYLKMRVAADELGDFLQQVLNLGIRGLSVTMPLKEKVIEYCSDISPDAKAMGAVNTLAFHQDRIIGYNTDGPGTLAALETYTKVQGKKVVVLGAGGVAKAICWQLVQAGADVVICNRDIKKAEILAFSVGCAAQRIDHVGSYSVIINATSASLPIDPQYIIPGSLAMDVTTVPKQTLFLQHALQRGCQVVYGYELFIKQALLQFAIWFDGCNLKNIEHILAKSVIQEVDKISKFP